MNEPPASWAGNVGDQLALTLQQRDFYSKVTGIAGLSELEEHIKQVQSDALKVRPYHCIEAWKFLDFRCASLPAYEHALGHRRRENALFIDCGCAVGTDVRKAILDGFPADRIIGTDLEQDFIAVANATTPTFLAGDLFTDTFLDTDASPILTQPLPVLSELKKLTPLRERATVVSAGSLFHLFDDATQRSLARRLYSLLSFDSGSLILGGQVGARDGEEGPRASSYRKDSPPLRYIHSPSSWKALWRDIDPDLIVDVEIDAGSGKEYGEDKKEVYRLMWSATRP